MAAGVHGFPAVLTSFIGRAGPVREIAGLLEQYRLVTVTGPGGCLARQLPGAINSELAHVRALPVTLIATSWLSKCIVGSSHIEYVVDDLKQHAQLGGETAKGCGLRPIFDPCQQ